MVVVAELDLPGGEERAWDIVALVVAVVVVMLVDVDRMVASAVIAGRRLIPKTLPFRSCWS